MRFYQGFSRTSSSASQRLWWDNFASLQGIEALTHIDHQIGDPAHVQGHTVLLSGQIDGKPRGGYAGSHQGHVKVLTLGEIERLLRLAEMIDAHAADHP